MMKILNIGSINKDFFYSVDNLVKPGETISSNKFDIKLGGKGLNQSVAISMAGNDVYHAGLINKNDLFIIDKLKKWNVNSENISLSETPTGHAIIQVDKNGENSIIINGGSNHRLDVNFINNTISKFNKDDYLLIQNEVNLVDKIIDIAHEKGLKIIFNPAPFNENIHNYNLNKVAILILNQTEGKSLSGENNPEKIIKSINEKLSNTEIILTLGKRGSIYSYKENTFSINAEKVNSIDSTGAGDTFIGYYIASIVKGMSIKDSLIRAGKAAAISTTKLGAAESIPKIN